MMNGHDGRRRHDGRRHDVGYGPVRARRSGASGAGGGGARQISVLRRAHRKIVGEFCACNDWAGA